jgi:hypothetical protein
MRKCLSRMIMKQLEQTNICFVCKQSIVMPHESIEDCQHYFCYVHAYSLIQQLCPICCKTINNIKPKEFSSE